MNEYRIQRLKEDLTFAQQRNKHQKQQLANYKNVHEKDLKEIERLNNALLEIEAIIYNEQLNGIEARISIQEVLDKIKELEEK